MNEPVEIWDEAFRLGQEYERERIFKQWQYEMNECKCDNAMGHMERRIKAEIPIIKGENK